MHKSPDCVDNLQDLSWKCMPTNFEASEQKMEELMRECKEGFKKDSYSEEKLGSS